MMTVIIDPQAIVKVMLINTRVSVFFLLLPIFSIIQLPTQIRILFALLLAFFIAPTISVASNTNLLDDGLPLLFIYEAFTGSVMAFGVMAAFAAFQLGGRFLDLQMGFGVAALIDPATRQQTALLGSVLSLMGITVFVLEGGHRLLIQALHQSFVNLPIGQFAEVSIDLIVKQFGLMFVFAVLLVMPVLIMLLLLDALMAVAARTMPQLNIFILSIPVKIFFGVILLGVVVKISSPLLQKIYLSIFEFLGAL